RFCCTLPSDLFIPTPCRVLLLAYRQHSITASVRLMQTFVYIVVMNTKYKFTYRNQKMIKKKQTRYKPQQAVVFATGRGGFSRTPPVINRLSGAPPVAFSRCVFFSVFRRKRVSPVFDRS